MMKKLIKRFIPNFLLERIRNLRNYYFNGYSIRSYSQEGEDMVLRRIFEKQTTGFYVDVGAHHPLRFSNTYHFYKHGWHGINIDAMPGSMEKFHKFRSNDLNIEVPIGNNEQVLTYFAFNEPALNTFSEKLARERDGKNGYFIQQEIKLKTLKLSSVLDRYLPSGTVINFLSIDVEGFDLEVLLSNNWEKYKPECILVEIAGSSLFEIENTEVSNLLRNQGYDIFAKTVHTVIFMHHGKKQTHV